MMSPLLVSFIIIMSCLILGAIGVIVYITVFRSQPENKGKDYSTSTAVLIMTTALLAGVLLVIIYFLWTWRTCPECSWGAQDSAELKGAELTFDRLQKKANMVPRNMSYTASCDADPSGGACGIIPRPPVAATK